MFLSWPYDKLSLYRVFLEILSRSCHQTSKLEYNRKWTRETAKAKAWFQIWMAQITKYFFKKSFIAKMWVETSWRLFITDNFHSKNQVKLVQKRAYRNWRKNSYLTNGLSFQSILRLIYLELFWEEVFEVAKTIGRFDSFVKIQCLFFEKKNVCFLNQNVWFQNMLTT